MADIQLADEYLDSCVVVKLKSGRRVKIELDGTDGWFVVDFGFERLFVISDMHDESCRGGTDPDGRAVPLYLETFER